MKRITILESRYTVKDNKSWLHKIDSIVLFDVTDLKLNDKLNELNENKKRNKYSIVQDFNLKSVSGKKSLQFYIISTSIEKIPFELRKLKHAMIETLHEFMEEI